MERGRSTALATVVAAVLFSTVELAGSQSNTTFPVITQQPLGSIEKPGDPVSLFCTAGGAHLLDWYRDSNYVASGPLYSISMLGESNAGNYTCRATIHDVGTITSAIARVELSSISASPPGELDTPVIQTVPINTHLVLNCGQIISTPPVTYQWATADGLGDFIFPSYGIIKGSDGLLYLPLVTRQLLDGNFVFKCQANNFQLGRLIAGFIQLSAASDADSPSSRQMMAVPQDLTVAEGESAYFQCIVGGSPLVTENDITWITPANGIGYLRLQSNAILYIRNASLEHAGGYSCNVTGLGVFSAALTVLVPPIISVPPEPLYSPVFGDALSISCDSSNTLVSEWIWYHNGVRITNSDTFEISTTGNTLSIGSAHNKEHDGLYQCFAYNSAGNDSATTSVRVTTYLARLVQAPSPESQLLFEGDTTVYSCVAHGAPPPYFIWLHNGAELVRDEGEKDSSARETTSHLELSELGVGESGVYTCRAVNEVDGEALGSEDAQVSLEVIVPTNVTRPSLSQPLLILEEERTAIIPCLADAQDGVTLNFTWLKDDAPLAFDGLRVNLSIGADSANVSLTSVEKGDGGIYLCRVVSLYRGLVGPVVESAHLRVTTTPKLLIPPKILPISETEVTSSSFAVGWYFPGQQAQAKLTSYTVSYRELEDPTPIFQIDKQINDDNTIVISSSPESPIRPYTVYNVTVWANYITGEVLGESVLIRTGEDRPGPPGGVTGTVVNITTVYLEWELPAEPNGVITNYSVRYKQEPSQSFLQTVPLISNSTHHYLSPLLQRASYLVEVAASTSVGLGPYSEAITVSTDNAGSQTSGTPVYQEVWFIVVVFVVALVLVIAGLLVVCGVKYAQSSSHSKQKYNVQSKQSQTDKQNGHNTRSLTEDDMKDYNGRGSRLNGENSNIGLLLLDGQESESSAADKYPYESSLSTASHISSQAPAYINPPPFQEAIKSLHAARLSPAYSESTLDQVPPSTTADTIETESSLWAADSKTRMLQIDQSPSPARSYQPSPLLHSSPPPPPIPTAHRPPPPPPPTLPQSPEHKYASLSELDHRGTGLQQQREGDGERNGSHPASPQPGYDANGYSRLPVRPSSQQRMRISSTPGYQYHRTTSPQGTTPVASSPLQNTASAAVASSSQDVASSFHTRHGGSQTMTSSQANPLYLVSSSQNMRSNTATGAGFRRGSAQQQARGGMRPKLAKTSSQPNFATFV